MTIIEQLDEAIRLAERQGVEVLVEFLGETPGGYCRVGQKARVYLDLAASPAEHLDTMMDVLATLGVKTREAVSDLNIDDTERRAA